jgi:hypothetical protein
MLIMAVHQTPSLTQQKYEAVVRRLTGGDGQAQSLSEFPFDGLLVHITGQGTHGFYVVDIFESEDAVNRFREAVTPIAQEVGIDEPPEFFPAHTALWRR